jgi:hypothetical protein
MVVENQFDAVRPRRSVSVTASDKIHTEISICDR